MKDKGIPKLVVFGVGASRGSEAICKAIIEANHLGETPFFYLPGGMQFDKLNFFMRFMLKRVMKINAKNAEKSEQDSYMEQVIGTNYDISDRKYIQELTLSVIKSN